MMRAPRACYVTNMSDLSRTVHEEQLPLEDLQPVPTPVINLGHLSLLDSKTRSRVIDDIAKACRDLGYFQVINHGINQSVMDNAVKAASAFFKLPNETKEEFASDDLRQPGLEVANRSSNSWKMVQQLPHALHVHIGDNMEVLSNGRIKTVVHRAVLNPKEGRISIASIHGFALHENVTCAKEFVDEQNPQKYKESSFTDFLDHLTANMDNKHRNFLESLRK
ncbi:hypothetical protein EJB05_31484, partial [Eragrostis curvula]